MPLAGLVTLPDGGLLHLTKLERDHDPRDLSAAKALLAEAQAKQQFLTGIFYINENRENLHEQIDMVDTPLSELPQSVTRPSRLRS